MLLHLAQAGPAPAELGWWLASRASGVVALLCVTVSVGIGLAMAGRVAARPLARTLMAVHQHTALAGLVAIAVHGITLLGDGFLSPSLGDIAIPFTSAHEPLWTGIGVTGGWLAAILGLTYDLRDRIGPKRWRSLHRATILVYVFAVAHTLGSGTDAGAPWLLALLALTGAPVVFLLVMRVMAPRPATPFRRLRVAAITAESETVTSFELEPADRRPLPPFRAGQFLPVRIDVPGHGPLARSYSLSAPDRYRMSVKRDGRVSTHLHDAVRVGDIIQAGAPAGRFVLDEGSDRPVVLLSAGIGVTPVLAMLASLAATRSHREVWWIHCARSAAEHAFAGEAAGHLARLPRAHAHVRYSARDGRLTAGSVLALGVPLDADVHVCGTPAFVGDLTEGLKAGGVATERVRSEAFGGPAPRPRGPRAMGGGAAAGAGMVATGRAAPGDGVAASGGVGWSGGAAAGGGAAPSPTPTVAFARSDIETTWDEEFVSLLDLAEAHAVPNGASCRVGSCHGCRATVLAGAVHHDPEPLDPPPPGSALLCCAQPAGDVVLDV